MNSTFRRFAATFALMTIAACLFAGLGPVAQAQIPFNGAQSSVFPNYPVATVTSLTATAQTSASFGMPGSSYGVIQIKATAITTVTWAIQGSIDGGVTFFPLNTAAILVPGTVAATETSTANGLYVVNLAGITNVRFVTSSTFTATGLTIKLVTTSNKGLL
jgi:hypothetical protein